MSGPTHSFSRVLDSAIAQGLSERLSDVFRTPTFGEVIAGLVVEACERLDQRAVARGELLREVARRAVVGERKRELVRVAVLPAEHRVRILSAIIDAEALSILLHAICLSGSIDSPSSCP